jgi:hypothetical protein
METVMSRNRNQKDEDETPQRRAEPEQPLTKRDETVERDPMNVPEPPPDAEPKPSKRPDLDWAEHED